MTASHVQVMIHCLSSTHLGQGTHIYVVKLNQLCQHIIVIGLTCYLHYDDVIMDAIASQITSLTIVYSSVYSGADQSKHPSSASLAFVWGIHRGPVNSPHKWPVKRKCFHLMTSSWNYLERFVLLPHSLPIFPKHRLVFWIQITEHAWMHRKSLRFERIGRYISDQSSKDVSKCAVDHLNESRRLHIFVDENDGHTSVIWSPGWGNPHAPKAGQWGRLSGFPGVTGWSNSKTLK